MSNILTNKKNILKINLLFFVVLIIFGISGYSIPLKNYILLALFILWAYFAFIENNRCFIRAICKKQVLCFSIFLTYYTLTSLFVADINYTLTYVAIYIIHYMSMIYFSYYYYQNKKILEIISKFSLIIWLIFCIIAIGFYIRNPSAARILASNYIAFGNIAIGGGYALAFGSAIINVFFFDAIISGDIISNKKRKIAITSMVILGILVYKTESTLTLIGMLLGFTISIFKHLFYKKQSNKNIYIVKQFFLICFVICLILVITLSIVEIGEFIQKLSINNLDNVFWRRIYSIGEKLSNFGTVGHNVNYIDERWETVQKSIEGFMRSPLIGNGYKYGNIFAESGLFYNGQHSAWMDALSSHGIIGGGALILIYVYAMLEDKKRGLSSYYSYIPSVVFLCIVNPFQTFQSCFALFFMIPSLSWYFTQEKCND